MLWFVITGKNSEQPIASLKLKLLMFGIMDCDRIQRGEVLISQTTQLNSRIKGRGGGGGSIAGSPGHSTSGGREDHGISG